MNLQKNIEERRIDVNGHAMIDFGKDAFGRLEIELDGTYGEFIEVVLGEVSDGSKILHEPGWRTFLMDRFPLQPGIKWYPIHIPEHIPAYAGFPQMRIPSECGGELTPFRYVEINRYYSSATVRRISYLKPLDEKASHFESSDTELNQLWEFCRYSIQATTLFDCYIDGERERMPYEGDTYVTQLSHFCCDNDYTIARRTIEHFLRNGKHTWPTEWFLLLPMLVKDYLNYSGDTASIQQWLPQLPDRLLPQLIGKDGLLHDTDKIRDIVDWPEADRDQYDFGFPQTARFVPNAFRYGALLTMHSLTGKEEYRNQAYALRVAMRAGMLKNGLYTDCVGSAHSSLHTALAALRFGLAEADEIPQLRELIARKGMVCSVYMAQYLLEVAFENGMSANAMQWMKGEGLRSWKNMLKAGATITTEAWDESLKPLQDWNHPWSTAPANIIPRYLCGIRPIEPGFRKFLAVPAPNAPSEFCLLHPTPYGILELVRQKGKDFLEFHPSDDVSLKALGGGMYEIVNHKKRVFVKAPFRFNTSFRHSLRSEHNH